MYQWRRCTTGPTGRRREGIWQAKVHREASEVVHEKLGWYGPATRQWGRSGPWTQGVGAEGEAVVALKGADGSADDPIEARDRSGKKLGARDARGRSRGPELVSEKLGVHCGRRGGQKA